MNERTPGRQLLEILFVEDQLGEVLLIEECFRRTGWPVHVSNVINGEECLKFLERADSYAQAPMPQLLLLDLFMPATSGHEVMEALLADQRFRHLPVVIFTVETDEQAIRDLYALRCSTYIVKPWGLEELQRQIKLLCDYWFGVVTLPRTEK